MRRFNLTLSMALGLSLFAISAPARGADPTAGDCLAANNNAIELRNHHKLRAARGRLLLCAAASCPKDIRKECIRQVDEMGSAIPTVIFEAKDGAGNDLGAVQVTMDGEPFAPRLDGTALPVDPGEHTFAFETAGQPTLVKQLVVREAEKDWRESVTFGAPALSVCPSGTERAEASGPCVSSAVQPADGLGTQRVLAIVAGAVGVVGVGAGSIFGLQAMSKRSEAYAACPRDCGDQNGVNLWNDARSAAQFSDIAFVVGGVALVGGAVLWWTARPAAAGVTTEVGFGPGSVQLKGVW